MLSDREGGIASHIPETIRDTVNILTPPKLEWTIMSGSYGNIISTQAIDDNLPIEYHLSNRQEENDYILVIRTTPENQPKQSINILIDSDGKITQIFYTYQQEGGFENKTITIDYTSARTMRQSQSKAYAMLSNPNLSIVANSTFLEKLQNFWGQPSSLTRQ